MSSNTLQEILLLIYGAIIAVFLDIVIRGIISKIKQNSTKSKLKELLPLINDWFDYLDQNMDRIDNAVLNNKENKIFDFLNNNLKNVPMCYSKRLVFKWNHQWGHEKKLRYNIELFEKSARTVYQRESIDGYCQWLIGESWKFFNARKADQSQCKYAEVEMRVKFIRFYINNI